MTPDAAAPEPRRWPGKGLSPIRDRKTTRVGLPDHLGFEPAVDVRFSEKDFSLEFDISRSISSTENSARNDDTPTILRSMKRPQVIQ